MKHLWAMSHRRRSAAATETQGNLGKFLYRWSVKRIENNAIILGQILD